AHLTAVSHVVVAARKFETTLHQVSGVVIGVVEARGNPEPKNIRGVKVGVVEGVDVGAQRFSEGASEFFFVVDGGNCVEVRLERSDPAGFDSGFVHVGVVKVGDFAG